MRSHQPSMLLLLSLISTLGAVLAPASGWAAGAPCAPPFLVKDILPGEASSIPAEMAALDGVLFFAADDGVHGVELWRSDGTDAGTRLVLNIRSGGTSASPRDLTVAGGRLFFVVSDGDSGIELWLHDERKPETRLIRGFPNQASASGFELTAVGKRVFFKVDDPVAGEELWVSDGTFEGTVLVEDIRPGGTGSFPGGLTAVGGTLFFQADDGSSGYELWKSDGTKEGTQLVEDIAPGGAFSNPRELTAVGNRLFFLASNDGDANLWVSDGTPDGTHLVKNIYGTRFHPQLSRLTAVGDTLFLLADREGEGKELWKSDGTEAGTVLVRGFQTGDIDALTAVEGVLFFAANDGVTGRELWRSDGRVQGTRRVKDINPGGDGSDFTLLAPGPGVLLFVTQGESSYSLWQSNATEGGTFVVANFASGTGSPTSAIMRAGAHLFFVASQVGTGEELFALPVLAVDCTPPTVTCPANMDVEAISAAGASVAYPPPTATDDSLSALRVSYLPPAGSTLPLGETTVTTTVRDAADNATPCTFRVRVRDTTPPRISCPGGLYREATSRQGAVASYPVMASDAVSGPGALVVTAVPPPGSVFGRGKTPVSISATDEVGNKAVCEFSLEVSDTVPPRLTCPADVSLVATSAEGEPAHFEAKAEDAVSSVEPSYSIPSGSTFPVGRTPVVVTATDEAGNGSQCTFQVEVLDLVGPEITCPEAQVVGTEATGGRIVHFTEASAQDDLAPPTVSYSPARGSVFPLGETLVTATATDLGGNTASCTFTVTVQEEPGGCGCGAGAGGSVGWLLLMLFPLWARRRAARVGA